MFRNDISRFLMEETKESEAAIPWLPHVDEESSVNSQEWDKFLRLSSSAPRVRKRQRKTTIEDESVEHDGFGKEAQEFLLSRGVDVLGTSYSGQQTTVTRQPPKTQLSNSIHATANLRETQEVIELDFPIQTALKPHQREGVRFLWDHIGLREDAGCILADYMGLGKTLQTIAVIEAFIRYKGRTVLVLAPAIVVRNWESEFSRWLPDKVGDSFLVTVFDVSKFKTLPERAAALSTWQEQGGVMLMGYEMFRNLAYPVANEEFSTNKALQAVFKTALCSPGPELIVLDEAHRIRSSTARLYEALKQVKTRRRILLTGYPMQNHLMEYFAMVDFARPQYLGTREDFKRRFEAPIVNGQCVDSSFTEVMLSRKRSFVLTQLMKPLVLRRGVSYLYSVLPPKQEWVLHIRLSKFQGQLYRAFLRFRRDQAIREGVKSLSRDILSAYHISLMIVNHPDIMFEAIQSSLEGMKATTSAASESGGNSGWPNGTPRQESMGFLDNSAEYKECDSQNVSQDATSSHVEEAEAIEDNLEEIEISDGSWNSNNHKLAWAQPLFQNYEEGRLQNSAKMSILMRLIQLSCEQGERMVVFSQSLVTLDLAMRHIAATFSEVAMLRIDGSTPLARRSELIAKFNDPSHRVDVMLVSTRAGGEGVNLVGGSRVVIMDVCWNPSHDHQSMCRCYRFGQTRPVYVYRFVASGTLERKIYDRQLRKEGLSKRIIDDTAIGRRFSQKDLKDFFDVNEFKRQQRLEELVARGNHDEDVEVIATGQPIESDAILATIITEFKSLLTNWYLQDTMLEQDDSENIPDEEKHIVIQEYEDEKRWEAARQAQYERLMKGNDTNAVSAAEVANLPLAMRGQNQPVFQLSHQPFKHNSSVPPGINVPSYILDRSQQQATHGAPPGLPGDMYTNKLNRMQTKLLPTSAKTYEQTNTEADPGHNFSMSSNFSRRDFLPRPQAGDDQSADDASVVKDRVESSNTHPLRPLRIMMIKRGIADSSELQAAAEALGAQFDVEVTENTTHLVTVQNIEKVMERLQITKLPEHIAAHDVTWLRESVRRKQAVPANQFHAPGSRGFASAGAIGYTSKPTNSEIDLSSD